MLKLRQFSVFALAIGFCLSAMNLASANTIRVAYETPDTHLKARTVAIFKKELESLTSGVKVETYPSASLIPSKQEVSAAIRGQVEAIVPFISYYEAVTPKAKLLTTPLVFRSYEHLMKAMRGEVGASLFSDLEAKGLKPLGFWYETPTVVFTSKKKVNTLSDLKGLKIRTYPSATLESMLAALGANPTVIPGNEVYLALKNGVVDGAVTTPSFAVSIKLDEVLKYITDVKLVYGGYIFAMNKKAFDKLPAGDQEAVLKAASKATKWNEENIHAEVDVSIKKAEKNGVKVLPASAEEVARWQKAMISVHESMDPVVKTLMDKAKALN